MKRYGLLGVLVGAVLAAVVFLQVPATAQQTTEQAAWDVQSVSYSGGVGGAYVAMVKHNRVTGQTLVLTCVATCDDDEEWYDYPVAE